MKKNVYEDISFIQNDKIDIRIILCTTPNKTSAYTIAKKLLDDNLAACVTLLPQATSLYYWKGTLKEENEVQLLIKSDASLQEAVFNQIKTIHPYEVPELLVLPIKEGDPGYLSWLYGALR